MAIKRTSSNSISNAVKLSTGFASAAIPNSPTIGAATATSDVAATVAYTAAVLGATGSTFTATSNPGSVTGTGSSPITVTGLTASTSYTFSVTAGNANGTSAASSASNSITTSAPLSSYESIATVTVSSATPTITFSSIPATFEHLQIRAILRNTSGSSGSKDLFMNFNGDTNTNYRQYKVLFGDGSSAASAASGTSTAALNKISPAHFLEDGNTASIYNAFVCDILDYRNTNKYKVTRSFTGQDLNGSGRLNLFSGLWQSTSAITSIDLTVEGGNNFKQYTQFALYGIKGA